MTAPRMSEADAVAAVQSHTASHLAELADKLLSAAVEADETATAAAEALKNARRAASEAAQALNSYRAATGTPDPLTARDRAIYDHLYAAHVNPPKPAASNASAWFRPANVHTIGMEA